MSFQNKGHGPLDYQPCRYDGSPMTFRGPRADIAPGHVLCLGGTETFGKFAPEPFPVLLEKRLGRQVVNMGAVNAGVDLMLHDPAIRAVIATAGAVVLQVPGAANLSNRFFTVHPRRNDRFVKASTMLRTIYRRVDFTEFHFTRHMLHRLHEQSADRFAIVVEELRAAWRARMIRLLEGIAAPVHLVWLSRRAPSDEASVEDGPGADPLFVTEDMLQELDPLCASVSICLQPRDRRSPASRGLFFGNGEEAAARLVPGPEEHDRVATMLAGVLE